MVQRGFPATRTYTPKDVAELSQPRVGRQWLGALVDARDGAGEDGVEPDQQEAPPPDVALFDDRRGTTQFTRRAPFERRRRRTLSEIPLRQSMTAPEEDYLPLQSAEATSLRRRAAHHRERNLVERVSILAVTLALIDLMGWLWLGLSDIDGRLALILIGVLALSRPAARLYRPRLRVTWLDDLPRSLASWAFAAGAAVMVAVPLRVPQHQVSNFLRAVLVAAVVGELVRLACMALVRIARRRFGIGERTLIMGAGKVGQALAETMLAHPELGLKPVLFLDPDPHGGALPVALGSLNSSDLAEVIDRERIGVVVVSFALTREADLVDTVITAHQMRCAVLVVPRLFELHHDGPDVERLRGYPLVRLRPDPTTRISWWVKRVFDILMAALALILLAPVLTISAFAILLESGRPMLFHQTRIGLDGVPFRLHKLRSLRPDSEEEAQTTWNVALDARLGPVGRFVRRSSIDELPQLWNILRGQMSFVGPRPERPGYVELFSIEYERYWARHRVPAGLTGLSQVNGLRGDTSISERARYDNYYIANWSLWLDARIMLLTVREILLGGGG